jgi:hypothetical protein
MWCPYVLPSNLEGLYMSHVPCFTCCLYLFQLFQLNVSYVSSECFSCFDKLHVSHANECGDPQKHPSYI